MFRAATIITLALALAAPVLATDPAVETQVVRVARTSVDSPAGAHRLERRIAVASLEVCGASAGSVAEMKAAIARSQCYRDSYAEGIAQVRTDVASLPPSHSTGKP